MATAFQLTPQTPSAAPKWYDADLKRLHRALGVKYRQLPDDSDLAHTISEMMDAVEGLDCDMESIGGVA